MEIQQLIANGLQDMNIPHSADAPQKMERFLELLLEKNKVMNLTAITEPEEAADKHMLDCAAVAGHFDLLGKQIIDVGCGAGFPSVPLLLLGNGYNITLLDSLQKRLTFIGESMEIMNEPVPKIVHARAEEAAQNAEFREKYDVCLSRAVASLNVLCEMCLPYLKIGGTFVAMKSVSCDEEVEQAKNAIKLLGGGDIHSEDYTLPSGISHRLIFITKVKSTNKKYPRKFSQIKKAPL